MSKYLQEDLEFERNKAAILALSGTQNKNASLWDFEIEAHRKRKKLDRFLIFGAFCGILSLIGTLYILYQMYL